MTNREQKTELLSAFKAAWEMDTVDDKTTFTTSEKDIASHGGDFTEVKEALYHLGIAAKIGKNQESGPTLKVSGPSALQLKYIFGKIMKGTEIQELLALDAQGKKGTPPLLIPTLPD